MIGELSKEYESNGDIGAISSGYNDAGGKSYGMYQLASAVGSVDAFIQWGMGQDRFRWMAEGLGKYEVGSYLFDNEWTYLANNCYEDFYAYQHEYIVHEYYDVSVELLRGAYFNIEKHSETMKDVIFSRAVQYGVGNIVEMFEDALKLMEDKLGLELSNLSYVDEKRFDYDLITSIYDVCMSYEWNHSALRDSLNMRFESEKEKAIRMLSYELGI
jgi:hypothetical protein|nr:MAG TPA: chitosanase [Bacteriophage sp.]